MWNFNLCAVLKRAEDYDLNFRITSFHAWRILSFVSGFCSFIEFELTRRGPIFNLDTKADKQTGELRAAQNVWRLVPAVDAFHSNGFHRYRCYHFRNCYL